MTCKRTKGSRQICLLPWVSLQLIGKPRYRDLSAAVGQSAAHRKASLPRSACFRGSVCSSSESLATEICLLPWVSVQLIGKPRYRDLPAAVGQSAAHRIINNRQCWIYFCNNYQKVLRNVLVTIIESCSLTYW